MAKTVSAGRVYLGQEGSGQAQILTPFDATKFPQQEMAITEKRKEDEQEQLKEQRKNFKLTPEEVDKGWNNDIQYYSERNNDLLNKQMQLYIESAQLDEITNPQEYSRKSTELLKKEAALNREIETYNIEMDAGMQNKGYFDDLEKYVANNQNSIDVEATEYNKRIFLNPEENPDLMKLAGGNRQQARILWKDKINGGSLWVDRFDHANEFQKPIKDQLATTASKQGWGQAVWDEAMGDYKIRSGESTTYVEKQQKDIVLADFVNDSRALRYLRDNPDLQQSLLEYTGVKDVNNIPFTGKDGSVYAWLRDTEDGLNWMREQYFLKDERSSKETVSGSGGGSGVKPIDATNITPSLFETIEVIPDFVIKAAEAMGVDPQEYITKYPDQLLFNVAGSNAQQLSKNDQKSTNATIAMGDNAVLYDPLTGNRTTYGQVKGKAGVVAEDGQGLYVNKYYATTDVNYTDNKGNKKTAKAGQPLPPEALNQLSPLKDYTTKMIYITSVSGQINKDMKYIHEQDAYSYTNAKEASANTAWNNDKETRKATYNKVIIDGENGGDWVEKRANQLGGDWKAWQKAEQEAVQKFQSSSTGGSSTGGVY